MGSGSRYDGLVEKHTTNAVEGTRWQIRGWWCREMRDEAKIKTYGAVQS